MSQALQAIQARIDKEKREHWERIKREWPELATFMIELKDAGLQPGMPKIEEIKQKEA